MSTATIAAEKEPATRDAPVCSGGHTARFTRPVRPTSHCGDPACACMVGSDEVARR